MHSEKIHLNNFYSGIIHAIHQPYLKDFFSCHSFTFLLLLLLLLCSDDDDGDDDGITYKCDAKRKIFYGCAICFLQGSQRKSNRRKKSI